MRTCGIFLFLILIAFMVPLCAQQSGSGTAGSSETAATSGFSENSNFQGVENASEQAASSGSFVGGGRPSAFAGIDEIYSGTSASNRSSTSSSRRLTTTRRATSRTTASRRTASQSGGARSSLSGRNGQFVRATAKIDFDFPRSPFEQRTAVDMIGSNLKRIQGIQGSQITLRNSPIGTTAVLTGTVATERERRVAKQLLLLEPGVNQVENLLEIR